MRVAEHKISVTLIFAKNFGRPKAAGLKRLTIFT